jgi:plastocyanin
MVRFSLLGLSAIVVGACGSDANTPDAPEADARPATVVTVTCPSTPAATVITSDSADAYSPMDTMITQGQIVEFMTSVTHNVVPDAGGDPGLVVGFHTTGCLMFTEPGTFGFHCEIHLFRGSVMVQ